MRTSSESVGAIAIEATGLGKQYLIAGRGRRQETLRDTLASAAHALISKDRQARRQRDMFWALKDVSFQIRQGENVGILGLNGAGKSTLLKVLSRVTDPTAGSARIEGRLGSLLEVGTGFHGELTGRENIFLYGAILGMTRAEISRRYADIVAFSGIEDFINMPVKRYSSGMYVRLAFSVAAHLEPDILLLDEVLSVGDLPFQRKCMEFAKSLQQRRATILFVSHNMFSIKSMCERVIYLQNGQVRFDGPTDEGIELYESDCRLAAVSWAKAEVGTSPIAVTDIMVMDEAGSPKSIFDHGERLRLRFEFAVEGHVEAPNFLVAFIRSDGVACCCFSSELDGVTVDTSSRHGAIELLTPPISLVAELYTIEILVRERGFQKLICAQVGATFHVRHALLDMNFGVFHEPGQWQVEDERLAARPPAQPIGAAL